MSGFEVAGKCQERLTQTLIACLLKTHWCLLFLKFEGPSPNPFQGIQIKDLFLAATESLPLCTSGQWLPFNPPENWRRTTWEKTHGKPTWRI